MSNISKRRREGSRAKIKSMGDHKEFLKRITKTLYYGQLPSLPCLSLPVTEISCEVWSEWQRGRSVRRLHADAAAGISRHACVSPAALVLALLYMERLRSRSPDYLTSTAPADLFLITLMVGNKFLQDDGEDEEVFCSEWAASGGIDLATLKKLELQFLIAIDWNIFVNEESFEDGLQWLERRVALKQAQIRGFFTYGDLLAASEGGELARALLVAIETSMAAAASYLAGILTLLASALMVSTCLPSPPATSLTPLTPSPLSLAPTHSFPSPLTLTQYVPNSTLIDFEIKRPACCSKWTKFEDQNAPKRNWFDAVIEQDWKLEPWWSKSVLNWLYHSSLVNPLQRWLERVNEYADMLRLELRTDKCRMGSFDRQKCSQFNLSKLSALVVSVSDR